MSGQSRSGTERKERQEFVTVERHGDAIHIKLNCEGTFSSDEYQEFVQQVLRTRWLTRDEEQLENEDRILEIDGQFVGEGECHECQFEGYIVENDIGTACCSKCRSTNVGWPVR